MFHSKLLIAYAATLIAVLQCGCRESPIGYGHYQTVFQTLDPPRSSFLSGIEEEAGVTVRYTFSMDETEYDRFAARLVAQGYTAKKLLDGQFGSWSASNSERKKVFGQSKDASFGATYFYFEPEQSRLTAIARYTNGPL